MILAPIPRVPSMSRPRFASYLRDPAAPLVLTGAMDDWPAMRDWSPEFFADRFPDFPVRAHAPQSAVAQFEVQTCVAAYVAYLRDPGRGLAEGVWTKGDPEGLALTEWTLYAGNFNPAHPGCGDPDLVFRYVPAMPAFVDDWLTMLDARFRERCMHMQSHHFVYLSAPGGVTPLHHDFWDTHAFLAQVRGRKRAFLFAPDDMELLYAEEHGDVRRMMRDARYAKVHGWSGELGPGDMLIIPSRWMHYVETVETSVTYSADWIDAANWRAYVAGAQAMLDAPRPRKAKAPA